MPLSCLVLVFICLCVITRNGVDEYSVVIKLLVRRALRQETVS